MYFIDKQNARYQFRNALVDILVDNFVDFLSKFIYRKYVDEKNLCMKCAGSLPVISVFFGFMSCPIMDKMS